MKKFIAAILSILTISCSHAYQPKEITVFNLQLKNSTYAELSDILYDFGRKNRLNISWFGWYKVEKAEHWFERSGESSTFKIKLALLTEENGSIVISGYFDKPIASVSIDYADKKTEWIKVIDDFEKLIKDRSWVLEKIKTSSIN